MNPPPPPVPPPLPPSPYPARPPRPRSVPALILLGLSAAAYLVSLFLPVFFFESHEPVDGKTILAVGWMGFTVGQVAWYANVFYFAAIGLVLLRRYGAALLCSLPALPLGLQSLKATTYYFNESQGTPIAGLGSAFGVWMTALGLAAVSGAAGLIFRSREPSS